MGLSSEPLSKKSNKKEALYKIRKRMRQSGESYQDRKGEFVPAKVYQFALCKCFLQCHSKVNDDARKSYFSDFWKISDWNVQSNVIRSSITEVPVKRHYSVKKKGKTVHYSLGSQRVCKKVFCGTLGISPCRVDYILKEKSSESGLVSPDKRGKNLPPANKISDETIKIVQEFIKNVPKYVSHYSNSGKQYFHPSLTWKDLHNEYIQKCPAFPVGFSVFMKEVKRFNVSIYVPKTDTCSTCDSINAKLKSKLTLQQRIDTQEESKKHLERANFARNLLKSTGLESKQENSKLLCFSFDMERTQPIPYLETSVVFYKRQMWLYNLGINNRRDNKGSMFIWQETDGKRGSNEVVSCVHAFLNSLDLSQYDVIHTFSDGCGGQNKNKTFVSYIMYLVQTTNIRYWTHSFMESGHFYLPNDTDFGRIERSKKRAEYIFTASKWESLITKCNFAVTNMQGKFLEFSDLQKNLTFRKCNENSEKFLISKVKWMKVTKENPEVLEYKISNDPNLSSMKINFAKRGAPPVADFVPVKLYENSVKLSLEKYNDIISLLPYVPSIYHSDFVNLPHESKSRKIAVEILPDVELDDED